MNTFVFLAIYLTFLSGCLFACFCVDTESSGIKGFISRLFARKIPALLIRFSDAVLGKRFTSFVFRVIHWVMYERNPLLVFAYLLLIFGAYTAFFIYGFPLFPNPRVGSEHKVIATAGLFVCLLSFVKAAKTPPGRITDKNVELYARSFPRDGVLYPLDMSCETCKIPKPARSKHCGFAGYCVPRFDHYCVWLAQTVGLYNYKYFVLLLFLHFVYLTYAAITIFLIILSGIIEKEDLFNAKFHNKATGETYPANYTLIVFIMAIALGVFFCYHFFHLIRKGLTTNEAYKVSELPKGFVNPYNEGFRKNLYHVIFPETLLKIKDTKSD